MQRYESTLTILSVSHEYEGYYQCRAINDVSMNVTRAKFILSMTSSSTTTTTTETTNTTKTTIKTEEHQEKSEKRQKKIVKKKIAPKISHKSVIEIVPTPTQIIVEIPKETTAETKKTVQILKETKISTEENIEIHEEIEEIRVKIYKELISQEDLDNFKIADEVNEVLEMIEASKFGAGEQPLRELATIGYLVQRGITVSEITHLYNADTFPALKNPDAQAALVQFVEREGHGTIISEVLTEETVEDDTSLAATVGFRAFMRMIQMRHVTIEQVITNFKQEDFASQEWKYGEAKEKIVESSDGSEYMGSREVLSTGKFC